MKNLNFLSVVFAAGAICLTNVSLSAQSTAKLVGECEQKAPFAGWQGAAMEKAAVNVDVPAGQSFKYYGMKTAYLYLDDAAGALDYVLYADNNGFPGQMIKEFSGTLSRRIPISQIGPGVIVSEITVMFDTALELAGGKKYWISSKRNSWVVTDESTHGEAAFFEDGAWVKRSDPTDMVFDLLCDADIIKYDCTQHQYTGVYPNDPYTAPEIKRGTNEAANDIFIEKDKTFTMNKIEAEVISTSRENLVSEFDVAVYSDKNNAPDQQIASYKNIPIAESDLRFSGLFTDEMTKIYYASIKLPQSLTLAGGTSGTRYWVGLKAIDDNYDGSDSGVRWITYPSDPASNSKPLMIKTDTPSAAWGEFDNSVETGFSVFGECKSSLAVNENSAFEFKYYPNPVKNFLDLKSEKKINSITIYSIDGKNVMTKTIKANENRLEMSKLTPGTYIVESRFEDGSVKNFKIIKQ